MSEEFYDPINGLKVLVKRSAEDRLYDMDASDFDEIKVGNTLASVQAGPTVTSRNLVTGSSDPTIDTPSLGTSAVQMRISGGTNKEQYLISLNVVDSAGNVLTLEAMLYVEDPST